MRSLKAAALAILVTALGSPFAWSQSPPAGERFSLSIGGTYLTSRLGYSYAYVLADYSWGEAMTLTDVLDDKRLPGLGMCLGYFVSPRLELFGGVYTAGSRSFPSEVSLALPNGNFPGDIAYASASRKRSASHLDLLFGAKLHLGPVGPLGLYLGAGGCYAFATFDLMSDCYIGDHFDGYGFHEVVISTVTTEQAKVQAVGGFVMAGLEAPLTRTMSVYAEGAHKFARHSVVHPFSDYVGAPRQVGGNMGGPFGSVGFRVRF